MNLPLDTILKVAGVVSGVVVPIGLQIWARRGKAIGWEVTSSTRILNPGNKEKGEKPVTPDEDFEILYRGKRVEDPHIVIVKLVNNGGRTIEAKDFRDPLTIEVAEPAFIAWAGRVDGKVPQPSHLGSMVVVPSDLWNRGDAMEVQMVIGKYADEVNVGGRIVDGDVRHLAVGPPLILKAIFALFLGAVGLFSVYQLGKASIAMILDGSLFTFLRFMALAIGLPVVGVVVLTLLTDQKNWPDRLR